MGREAREGFCFRYQSADISDGERLGFSRREFMGAGEHKGIECPRIKKGLALCGLV